MDLFRSLTNRLAASKLEEHKQENPFHPVRDRNGNVYNYTQDAYYRRLIEEGENVPVESLPKKYDRANTTMYLMLFTDGTIIMGDQLFIVQLDKPTLHYIARYTFRSNPDKLLYGHTSDLSKIVRYDQAEEEWNKRIIAKRDALTRSGLHNDAVNSILQFSGKKRRSSRRSIRKMVRKEVERMLKKSGLI
jgi:hypothetical protein